jgi:hypothetical protein
MLYPTCHEPTRFKPDEGFGLTPGQSRSKHNIYNNLNIYTINDTSDF